MPGAQQGGVRLGYAQRREQALSENRRSGACSPRTHPKENPCSTSSPAPPGFIGKRLVKTLLSRKGAVVPFPVAARERRQGAALLDFWGVSKARAVPVYGDLTSKKLGSPRTS